MLCEEVISRGMSRTTCWKSLVRLEFDGMNQVRKLCSIIDEERRQMIPNKIMVSTWTVDLCGKPVRVAATFAASRAGSNDGKPNKHITCRIIAQPTGRGNIAEIAV